MAGDRAATGEAPAAAEEIDGCGAAGTAAGELAAAAGVTTGAGWAGVALQADRIRLVIASQATSAARRWCEGAGHNLLHKLLIEAGFFLESPRRRDGRMGTSSETTTPTFTICMIDGRRRASERVS